MKKIYVKIDGITCDNCRNKITKVLKKDKNIENVEVNGSIATIKYNDEIDKQAIVDAIVKINYYTDLKMISENKKTLKMTMSLSELFKISTIIIVLLFISNNLFGFNIFNVIPAIDSNQTLGILFVTGILTSIHCVSMCGAINLFASTSASKNFKKPILYNLGRLTSYTIIGGAVGFLGSVFKVNAYLQGTIIIVAAIFMFLMALNMMGMINIPMGFRLPKVFNKLKSKGSFVIGLLNGLMPCGPLQAMQLYALSTGSIFLGALSMFLFCLGTIPLMLFVGMISNFLNSKNRIMLNKIATVLILILSVIMFNRGLLGMGVDASDAIKTNYDNYLKAELVEDYQVVEFDLSYSNYQDFVVQKGIPVRVIINVEESKLTGCNNSIKMVDFDVTADLKVGENIIEFTPSSTGTFTYTCWMNMIKNKIVVIDDLKIFKQADNTPSSTPEETEKEPATTKPSCH